jgi:head-tail adaptor
MSITRFFVRDVTIVRAATVAGYGDGTSLDWDTTTKTTTKGWLDQLTGLEQQSGTRDTAVSTFKLFLPAGTDVTADDRVTVDDTTFDVEGPPASFWQPYGEHHLEVSLRRVDG